MEVFKVSMINRGAGWHSPRLADPFFTPCEPEPDFRTHQAREPNRQADQRLALPARARRHVRSMNQARSLGYCRPNAGHLAATRTWGALPSKLYGNTSRSRTRSKSPGFAPLVEVGMTRRMGAVMSTKRKSATGPVFHPGLIATVAASIMPRMECPSGWPDMPAAFLKDILQKQRAGYNPRVPYDEQDGTSPLDVIMQEAIYRARMLISYSRGESSWTQTLSKQAKQGTPQTRALADFDAEMAKEKLPISWKRLVDLVLRNSTDKMRRSYWFAYQAAKWATECEREHGTKVRVVWKSQETERDREDPACIIVDDEKAAKQFHRIALAKVEAEQFYRFYQEEGATMRKSKQRQGSRVGSKKSAKLRKKEEAKHGGETYRVGDGRVNRRHSQE